MPRTKQDTIQSVQYQKNTSFDAERHKNCTTITRKAAAAAVWPGRSRRKHQDETQIATYIEKLLYKGFGLGNPLGTTAETVKKQPN